MKMKKIVAATILAIAGAALQATLGGGQGPLASNFVPSASANPDYICVKDVTNQPCNVTSCGPWTDKTQVCSGTMVTKVAYYLIRTTCEPGYTRYSNGGNVGGSSGRQGADYTYATTSCTVTRVDTTAPIGEPSTL